MYGRSKQGLNDFCDHQKGIIVNATGGVKIKLVSTAGAAGMKPLLAPPIEHT